MTEPTHEEREERIRSLGKSEGMLVAWIAVLQGDIAEMKAENARLAEVRYLGLPCPVCERLRLEYDPVVREVTCEKCGYSTAQTAEACDEQKFPSSTLYSSPPAASRLSEWVRETHHKTAEAAEGSE